MMDSLSPVRTTERETFMDALRGFAILGIFIANLRGFSMYGFAGSDATGSMLLPNWDRKMLFLHHMFIEGKFYSIFSFLFGWGIALQLVRSEAKGIKAVSFIRRRLFIMLLLGAFHLLLWQGDIVFFYALLGFILLPLTRLSNKAALITGITFILLPILLYALKMHFMFLNYPAFFLFDTGDMLGYKYFGINSNESYEAFMKNATWFDLLKGHLVEFFYRYGELFFQSRIWKVLGIMLIGVVVGRTGSYKKILENKKLLYYIIAFGIIIALPANYMLADYMHARDNAYNDLKIRGLYRTIAYAIGVAPLAAMYVAIFALAFNTAFGKKILSVLSPVGKMAFTNYMLHTIIGSIFFLHPGLNYMGTMGPVYYTLFALIVFVFQIIGSHVWLKYFNYGPVEWVWRSATYRKWQPMRKRVEVNIN